MANGSGGDNATNKDKVTVLNRGTLVPASLAGAILMLAAGGAVWINLELAEIKFDVRFLGGQITQLVAGQKSMQVSIEHINDNNVQLSEFRAWVKLLKAKNPELDIPLPGD